MSAPAPLPLRPALRRGGGKAVQATDGTRGRVGRNRPGGRRAAPVNEE